MSSTPTLKSATRVQSQSQQRTQDPTNSTVDDCEFELLCGWEDHEQDNQALLRISPISLLHASVEEAAHKKWTKTAYRDIDDEEFCDLNKRANTHPGDDATWIDDTAVATTSGPNATSHTPSPESRHAAKSPAYKSKSVSARTAGSSRGTNRNPLFSSTTSCTYRTKRTACKPTISVRERRYQIPLRSSEHRDQSPPFKHDPPSHICLRKKFTTDQPSLATPTALQRIKCSFQKRSTSFNHLETFPRAAEYTYAKKVPKYAKLTPPKAVRTAPVPVRSTQRHPNAEPLKFKLVGKKARNGFNTSRQLVNWRSSAMANILKAPLPVATAPLSKMRAALPISSALSSAWPGYSPGAKRAFSFLASKTARTLQRSPTAAHLRRMEDARNHLMLSRARQ